MIKIIKQIVEQTNLSEQEAWWMIEYITHKSKAKLLMLSTDSLSTTEQQLIESCIQKINQESMPLVYLIGSVPFLDLTIKTKAPILIPRQETEEWVKDLVDELTPHAKKIKNILDIGTGSGCIALALAKHFPQAHISAIDLNNQALQLAQENAQINSISNITFIQSDLFESLPPHASFDLIVSNPPYIDPASKKDIMPQVTKWEDQNALFADNQGTMLLEQIIKKADRYICSNNTLPYQLVLEHDHTQKEAITSIAKTYNWQSKTKKDLFGNERTSWLSKKSN